MLSPQLVKLILQLPWWLLTFSLVKNVLRSSIHISKNVHTIQYSPGTYFVSLIRFLQILGICSNPETEHFNNLVLIKFELL
jgi:hypothetical protein